ncbi:hypothetical protein SS1G_14265 [Sclerotinia sclerotiorum 1980 UF-70]|uniref:MmgE/PrpD N-terminal domain-containing protein n=2 Tax=Sclerotinia sclerotiorum (strain ATCC 18683 / 1980 / Ss-1) TaxID=665079 RepID=A7F9I4_SCLS1|nr:hypothetical protein SS1G_14265 [Sclerotinia sclerotiorum 1980 UF-70]APA09217.1 hypothetical protein sscle_04g039870 [Sclerotinia sclerotiorum 1980 UF-70]EDO00395.1 hypothetical protein SS1G_14265 [Sclerotinia sclerotiorum 1980 UF-70]
MLSELLCEGFITGPDTPSVEYASQSPFPGTLLTSLLDHKGSRRVDAQHTALLDGIASYVYGYDDTRLDKVIHPIGPAASVLLAVAEWNSDFLGKVILLVLTVCVEVECKVVMEVRPEHHAVG